MEKLKQIRAENEKLNALIMKKSMRNQMRRTVNQQQYQQHQYANYGQMNMNTQQGTGVISQTQFEQLSYPNPQVNPQYNSQYMMINQHNMNYNSTQGYPNMNDPLQCTNFLQKVSRSLVSHLVSMASSKLVL